MLLKRYLLNLEFENTSIADADAFVDADYNGQDLSLIHDINPQVHIGALSNNGIDWVGDWTIDSGIVKGSESNDVIVLSDYTEVDALSGDDLVVLNLDQLEQNNSIIIISIWVMVRIHFF